jgi:hypothetical protein
VAWSARGAYKTAGKAIVAERYSIIPEPIMGGPTSNPNSEIKQRVADLLDGWNFIFGKFGKVCNCSFALVNHGANHL